MSNIHTYSIYIILSRIALIKTHYVIWGFGGSAYFSTKNKTKETNDPFVCFPKALLSACMQLLSQPKKKRTLKFPSMYLMCWLFAIGVWSWSFNLFHECVVFSSVCERANQRQTSIISVCMASSGANLHRPHSSIRIQIHLSMIRMHNNFPCMASSIFPYYISSLFI